MNLKRYLLTLLVVPVLLFTAKSYAKNISNDIQPSSNKPLRAFVVQDKAQDGSILEVSGESRKQKLEEIVDDLDILRYPEDKITIFPDLFLEMGGKITIERAPKIKLIDGKKEIIYRSWSKTVVDLFDEKNIILGADDKVFPALSEQISEGSEIKINRVAKTIVIENKPIQYRTIKKEDPNLDKGKQKIQIAGRVGSKDLYFEVIRQDGEEISKSLIESKVVADPIDEVLIIGTKPTITVRCKFNDTVLAASIKYKQDPDSICKLMMKESNGNPGSINPNGYYGLFQYELGLWSNASAKAGYAGADWSNPTAQIFTTAYLFSIGQSWRW